MFNEDKSFDDPDDLEVKVAAMAGSLELTAKRKIKVVFPRVEKINFDTPKPVILEGDWKYYDPEWTISRKDKSRSAFIRNSIIKVSAQLKIKQALTHAVKIKLLAESDKKGASCESKDALSSQGEKNNINMEGKEKLPDKICAYEGHNGHDDAVEYTWKYVINGETYTIDPKPEDNKHHVYVLLDKPKTTFLFETVLYITCNAAKGQNAQEVVVEKIWERFRPPLDRISRIDGKKLKYWGEGARTNGQTTLDLIKNNNATCGAWGRFFLGALKSHGINGKLYEIVPFSRLDAIMLISKWKFVQHINSGKDQKLDSLRLADDFALFNVGEKTPAPYYPSIFPESNMKLDSIVMGDDKKTSGVLSRWSRIYRFYPYTGKWGNDGETYGKFWGDLFELDGIGGQNNPDPPEFFSNHAVVVYGNKIYDPSYGMGPYPDTAGGLNSYENQIVTGFSVYSREKGMPFGVRVNNPKIREIKKGRTYDIAY